LALHGSTVPTMRQDMADSMASRTPAEISALFSQRD